MIITFKEIKLNELHKDMLSDFNRYQEVMNDWFPTQNGEYVLISQPHIEDWDKKYKENKVNSFLNLLKTGGKLFGAFDEDKLIGFSAIDSVLLGSENQYLELVQFHVSYGYRGKHIGKKLFELCVDGAAQYGCKKLYIVASSSEESQKAYQKLVVFMQKSSFHSYIRKAQLKYI